MAVTYADAVGAMKAWVNAQSTLVGAGMPLPKGATLNRLQGAQPACYVLLGQVGGTISLGVESPDMVARIGGQVYGPTMEASGRAAVQLAEALCAGLAGKPVLVAGIATLLLVDNITGPLWSPDVDEPRHLLDFDLYLRPV